MAASGGFCTAAEVKTRLGITDTSFDTILAALIASVANQIEVLAGRLLRADTSVVEYHSGGSKYIRTRLAPIKTATAIDIRESYTRDFTAAGSYTLLVDGTDFIYRPGETKGRSGILCRLYVPWMGNEYQSPGMIKVTFDGGYHPTTGEWIIPEALNGAAIAQCCYEIERRKNPGRVVGSQRGVSVASGYLAQYAGELDILPQVKTIAEGFRRKY